MDEAAAALDRIRPSVAVTYAEAGGWGRALVLEARRRRIPTCGLQHGFVHRHWLNYRHMPDEVGPSPRNAGDAGFPHPTATLLFDRFAARHLEEAGALPPAALIVTGNPRLDALASAAGRHDEGARREIRRRLGAADGARLLVLATKYRERARDSLAALFDAVRAAPAVHLAVRCHPAETPAPYVKLAGSAPNITVAPTEVDLAATLAVADLVVTVNSTVALEGMALGVPALALNLPNYLSPFVEAGVMLGCASPAEVAPVLGRFLADDQGRSAFRRRQQAFMAEYEMLPTGQAAERAVGAILDLARGPGGPH
jgi:UDP-N-acetylglucosamine 2-epimerase